MTTVAVLAAAVTEVAFRKAASIVGEFGPKPSAAFNDVTRWR
jgi:hypothetical protein